MTVKIEKRVPMPLRGGAKYPWDKLEVGDSFVVDRPSNGRALCIQAMLTRMPKKFESRMVKGVVRVWRTA